MRTRRLNPRLIIAIVLALVGALLVGTSPARAVPGSASNVFINELHYDNSGTDTGEAIEIAGPAGTDLGGWSLVLYNGSNGTTYNTTTLSGVLPDEGSGYGTTSVSYPSNGIQNGSPDGIALVDDSGAVVQFLSYEGTMTAVGGPADGRTSTDIGVAETGATPVGQSLQLVGTGTTATDFTWSGPAADSFGATNAGQSFGGSPPPPPPSTPDVFLSEFHYDNTGSDVGEFVEVAGPAGSDLSGWTVVLYNGNGGASYNTIALSGILPDQSGGLGYASFSATGLQNGSPDGLALVEPGGDVKEFLSYEGSFTATNGPAAGQTSTDVGVDEPGTTPIGQSLQLVDGVWTGPIAETPGAPPVLAPPNVWINEFHYDNEGTDTGEFVEVAGEAGSDLTGWSLVFYNGSNGAPYATEPLSGTLADQTDGYGFLVVNRPANGIQNGAPDGIALVDGNGTVVEFLSYEGTITAIGGPADGQTSTDVGVAETGATPVGSSLQRTGAGFTAADFAWTGPIPETPGAANSGQIFGDAPPPLVFIHEVQGSGSSVAITTPVTVEAIVTSLFEDDDELDGFFLQEEDADQDGDPATSEGIFVFCRGACPSNLAVGDKVQVTGTPAEFFGMSQIGASSSAGGSTTIVTSGEPLPSATAVTLPAADSTVAELTFEPIEGMIASFPSKLAVSEYFQLARFGQLVLTAEERPFQFTDENLPSVDGFAAFREDLATRRIILDDNNNDQNDAIFGPLDNEPYPYPSPGLSTTNFVRGGDTISGLTGVMHWSFAGSSGTNAWRVRPIDGIEYTFDSENPRPETLPKVKGDFTVASFNVLNYFTTIDEPGAVCGPSSLGCRGAHSTAELERQRDKIVAALAEIDADVVGLIEIENDDTAAVTDLLAALNAVVGAGTYDFIDTGAIGGDAIKVAFIYKPASVTPFGDFAILDSSVDPRFVDDKNRPALIQTFEDASGARFTAAVNHFKSKGSDCDELGDPDANDGQGNCNVTRTLAAQALADYLATDPTGSGDPDFMILGDLNAYAKEDPITTLEAAGYTDLIERFGGSDPYSFVFDGQLGYLDHALANPDLRGQVKSTVEWHINADEVPLLDYNDDIRDPGEASFERESNGLPIYEADAFRSSDHDPVVVGMNLVLRCGKVSGTPEQLKKAGWNLIVGTEAAETLRGTGHPDFILGRGGDDTIRARGGVDVVCGGDGDDTILGGNGNDYLYGENGDDTVKGQGNHDIVSGGAGMDDADGGNGDDHVDGGSGDDTARGRAGFDTVKGGADDDTLYGGSANDKLFGQAGDDDMRGGAGRDDLCDGGPAVVGDTADRACERVRNVP